MVKNTRVVYTCLEEKQGDKRITRQCSKAKLKPTRRPRRFFLLLAVVCNGVL